MHEKNDSVVLFSALFCSVWFVVALVKINYLLNSWMHVHLLYVGSGLFKYLVFCLLQMSFCFEWIISKINLLLSKGSRTCVLIDIC